jgi:Zn-dependent peptidase ImmA (M78 family)/transcriptional regulator with XRE-family HTH domain
MTVQQWCISKKMTSRIDALVNPDMLIWARKKCGLDLVGAAKRITVKSEQLDAWEKGETRPTIHQAMKMAEVYHRPLSLFYLDVPPKDFSSPMADFRRLPEVANGVLSPGFIWEKRQSEIRREIMIDLAEHSEDGIFPYINAISLGNNQEEVANQIREWAGIDWDAQRKWNGYNDAFNAWKVAFERLNVLVFQTSHIGITFTPDEARGFSISEKRFPVIVVNSGDAHGAGIFTLVHEFTHLLLNIGGICDCEEYSKIPTPERNIETFCNHVAGAVLVPAILLASHKIVRQHGQSIDWEDEEIWNLSIEFSVSEEVIVRRLLILGFTSQEFYEQKRQDFIKRWIVFKEKRRASPQTGVPPYYRLVLRKNGKPYTRQVFSAYYDKRLTLSDVADYLGVKIKHLRDIEHEAFVGARF